MRLDERHILRYTVYSNLKPSTYFFLPFFLKQFMIQPLYYRNTITSMRRNGKPYTGLSLSLNSSVGLIFKPVTNVLLYNGNITKCVPVRSVINRTTAKRKSDLLLRSMITGVSIPRNFEKLTVL